MMKLADMTVTGFADTVASDAPAPGGGSCAALYGSIGAALTAMVGGLTQGRKKYAEYAEHAAEVEKKGKGFSEIYTILFVGSVRLYKRQTYILPCLI